MISICHTQLWAALSDALGEAFEAVTNIRDEAERILNQQESDFPHLDSREQGNGKTTICFVISLSCMVSSVRVLYTMSTLSIPTRYFVLNS